ncbi:MAG: DHH family phosphoesterase [Candidatus Saccharimonadales bacterium]
MASSHERILREILIARGHDTSDKRQAFLDPSYDAYRHDPFGLPDMAEAVERLVQAHAKGENVVIYGDYDIDGLTATTLLLDAFASFGIRASAFIPNRFVEGYGLSREAIERIAAAGAHLIVTVDCGSLSFEEIARARELGVDVIVTDHHSVESTMPSAVAVINPKRLVGYFTEPAAVRQLSSDNTLRGTSSASSNRAGLAEAATLSSDDRRIAAAGASSKIQNPKSKIYPFIDLAGVGVAFKLVQALQTKLPGLEQGQEKWLLDLVALGTVCDVVTLVDENRANVRWGLEVLRKTRRPGLRALMAVARVKPSEVDARSLGFVLGPRLNASGRLETAQLSLDLLTATDPARALEIAEQLEAMNQERRAEQDRIFRHAIDKAAERARDHVLIVSDPSWSHGIIGIVAAKLLERYHKPTFVLQELDDGTAKGSARSFGDFSAVEGIRATEQHLIKGGGHKLAAGVTLKAEMIDTWRAAMNEYYKALRLSDQLHYLLPNADITLKGFADFTEQLIHDIARLEPYGNGNPSPVFNVAPVEVIGRRTMGDHGQHVKYTLADQHDKSFHVVAFNKSDEFTADIGDRVAVWLELTVNEWQGRRTVEGRLLRMEII